MKRLNKMKDILTNERWSKIELLSIYHFLFSLFLASNVLHFLHSTDKERKEMRGMF